MFCLPPTSRPSTRLSSAVSLSMYRSARTRTLVKEPSSSCSSSTTSSSPEATCRRRSSSVMYRLPRLAHPGAHAADLHALRLEHVPVRHEHAALGQVGHEALGHEVTGAIERGVPALRVQLRQTITDRDIGANDENRV